MKEESKSQTDKDLDNYESDLEEQGIKKPFFERAFSKIQKDSIRNAIFLILSCSITSGCFAYHHPLNSVGIFNTLILTIIIVISFIISIDILIKAFRKCPQAKDINEIIKLEGGINLGRIYDFFFMLFMLAMLISGFLTLSKLTFLTLGDDIMNLFHVSEENKNFEFFNSRSCYVFAFITFLLLLQKDLTSFSKVSFYGCFLMFYIIIVIICQFPFYFSKLKKDKLDQFNLFSTTPALVFKNFGTIVYCLNCTHNFHGIYKGIARPNGRRILKVFKRVFIIMGFLFMIMGCTCYFSLGITQTEEVDLFPFRNSIFENDTFMIIGRYFYIFVSIVSSVLNAFPLKVFVMSFFMNRDNIYLQIIVNFLSCLIASIIASNFTSINSTLSVIGSLTCIITCFTIPGMIAIKNNLYKSRFYHIFIIVFTIIYTFLAFICTYYSIKEFN